MYWWNGLDLGSRDLGVVVFWEVCLIVGAWCAYSAVGVAVAVVVIIIFDNGGVCILRTSRRVDPQTV